MNIVVCLEFVHMVNRLSSAGAPIVIFMNPDLRSMSYTFNNNRCCHKFLKLFQLSTSNALANTHTHTNIRNREEGSGTGRRPLSGREYDINRFSIELPSTLLQLFISVFVPVSVSSGTSDWH